MNMFIRMALALLAPSLACAQGPEQVAQDVNPDPAFEARYCSFLTMNTFNEYAASTRWMKVAHRAEEDMPFDRVSAISRDAFSLMEQAGSEKAKADYDQCAARLAVIEAQDKKPQIAATPSYERSPVAASSSVRQEGEGRRAGRASSSTEQTSTQVTSAEPSPMPPLPPGGSLFPPPPRMVMSESGVLREPPATRTGEDAFKCHESSVVPVTVCYNASFWLETTAPQEAIEAVFKSPTDGIQFALATFRQVKSLDAIRETLLQKAEAAASDGRYGVKITADKVITLDGHPWRILEYSANINGMMQHQVNVFTSFDGVGSAQIIFTPSDTDAYRAEIDEIISRISVSK